MLLSRSEFDSQVRELGGLINQATEIAVASLALRMVLCREMGRLKEENGQPLYRPEAESERLEKTLDLAKKFGLDRGFAALVVYASMNESLKQQVIQFEGGSLPDMNKAALIEVLKEALTRMIEQSE